MANSCGAGQVAGTPDLLPFSQDGSFGLAANNCAAGTPCYGDAGVIRSHYAFRLNSALAPDKYAQSHHFEVFILTGVGGLPNNLASDTNPENGGDAGGCIVPAAQAGTVCPISKATFNSVTKVITYTVGAGGCTGPAPANNSYIAVTGLQPPVLGNPDDGVFQVTATGGGSGLAGSTIKVASGNGGVNINAAAGVATLNDGCSQ
jgi:hypothetical protein